MDAKIHLSPGAHTVAVDGLTQSYFVAGDGPVCVVHPGGPGAAWDYLRAPLLEDYLTMVYLEPIGTGVSARLASHPQGYSVERFSKQLNGFLAALDLADVFLLGHSHGGFVVQHCALSHPERIAGLILYATSAVTGPEFLQSADTEVQAFVAGHPGDERTTLVSEAWASVPAISDDAGYTRAMRNLLPVYFADPYRPEIPLASMQEALRFFFVVGDGEPFDMRDALAGLDLPTLVVAGEDDFICGSDWASTLTTAIPHAEQAIFADCGHLAHVEQAGAFARVVADFVMRHLVAVKAPHPIRRATATS